MTREETLNAPNNTGSVMEEKEKEESEPLDLRSGDQAELILLVISGEEDATQDESALRGKIKIRTFFLNFILFIYLFFTIC